MFFGRRSGNIFVKRPDTLLAWDFEDTDFTKDNAFHDLDLSGIVPANAKAVMLEMSIVDGVADTYFKLREKGRTDIYACPAVWNPAINVHAQREAIIPVTSDGLIQYQVSVGVTDTLVAILGWII